MKSEISNPKSRRDFKVGPKKIGVKFTRCKSFSWSETNSPRFRGVPERLVREKRRGRIFNMTASGPDVTDPPAAGNNARKKNLNKILLGFFCHFFFVCENFRLLNVRKYRRNIKKISFYLCKCLSFPQENFFFVFVLETCEISFLWKFTPIFIFIFFFIYYDQNTPSY